MARFLSDQWVDDFNAAVAGVVLPGAGDGAGLAVADGPVTVAQEIHGGPEGDVRLLLHIEQGTVRLERSDWDAGERTRRHAGDRAQATDADDRTPDATMVLSYEDAAAMSVGDLSPADALNRGRIRVRGDLTVLVEAQHLLAAARTSTGELAASTTY